MKLRKQGAAIQRATGQHAREIPVPSRVRLHGRLEPTQDFVKLNVPG